MPINNNQKQIIDIDLAQAKRDYLEMFGEYLISTTESESFVMEELNGELLYIFLQDDSFAKELEKNLYSNQEKLADKEFVLDGKPRQGTVENWLKDFVKMNGTGIFDEMVLSKYLITSVNARKLSEDEKKTLRKLLMLYRNLRFFPESMVDRPIEQWEIIPGGDRGEALQKARTISGPPRSEEDKKRIELKNMLAKYPAGSIERKAVEEEIRKLENRSSR